MRRYKILAFIFICLCYTLIVFAQDDEDNDIPVGMEVIDQGGRSTYLIPKGAKKKIIGAQIVVEAPNEYMGRRFYEMEERFKKLEKRQEDTIKELEELKEIVRQLKAKLDEEDPRYR